PFREAHGVGQHRIVDGALQAAPLPDLAERHPHGERREAELLLGLGAGDHEREHHERERADDRERSLYDCHAYSSSDEGRGTTVVCTTTRSSRHAVPLNRMARSGLPSITPSLIGSPTETDPMGTSQRSNTSMSTPGGIVVR